MRISQRVGNGYVSMGLGGWLVVWFLIFPFVLAWLALKLVVVIVKFIVVLVQAIDDKPAIPPAMRKPPARR